MLALSPPVSVPSQLALELSKVLEEEAGKTVYYETKAQVGKRLSALSELIHRTLQQVTIDIPECKVLQQVFDQHFEVVQDQAIIHQVNKGSRGGIQSPDDPDCTLTKKAGKSVKGYSVNVTETNDPEGGLNLITSIIVEGANTSDTAFMVPGIKESEQVRGQQVEQVFLDGAYHSPEKEKQLPGIDLVFTGITGRPPRYLLDPSGENLLVTDTLTGQQHLAVRCDSWSGVQRWRLKLVKKARLFDEAALRSSFFRRKVMGRTQ